MFLPWGGDEDFAFEFVEVEFVEVISTVLFEFLFADDVWKAGDGESLVKFSLAHASHHVSIIYGV